MKSPYQDSKNKVAVLAPPCGSCTCTCSCSSTLFIPEMILLSRIQSNPTSLDKNNPYFKIGIGVFIGMIIGWLVSFMRFFVINNSIIFNITSSILPILGMIIGGVVVYNQDTTKLAITQYRQEGKIVGANLYPNSGEEEVGKVYNPYNEEISFLPILVKGAAIGFSVYFVTALVMMVLRIDNFEFLFGFLFLGLVGGIITILWATTKKTAMQQGGAEQYIMNFLGYSIVVTILYFLCVIGGFAVLVMF